MQIIQNNKYYNSKELKTKFNLTRLDLAKLVADRVLNVRFSGTIVTEITKKGTVDFQSVGERYYTPSTKSIFINL